MNNLAGHSGGFGFDTGPTGLPGASGRTGDGFASFLLGGVSSGDFNYLGIQSAHRFRTLSFFAQDDFRASQKLTFNLGLRWDRFSPLSDPTGRLSSFDPNTPNPGAGGIPGALIFAGTGQGRTGKNSFQEIWNKAFGPRAGLAYRLSERTVLRAGYGVFYQEPKESGWGGGSEGFFTQASYSTTNGYTPAFYLRDGFPTDFPKPPFTDPTFVNGRSITYADPKSGRPPVAQNWQASVEQQIKQDLMIELAYVGSTGHHLVTSNQIVNQVDPRYLSLGNLLAADIDSPSARGAGIPIPYAGFTGTVAQALRPYPQYQSVETANLFSADKTGNSTYNSLQAKLQGRPLPGLNVVVSYAWSKALNDGSDSRDFAGFQPNGNGGVQNGFNRRAEKALAAQDIPHNFVMSFLYELPWGPGKKALGSSVAGKLLGGWSIGGLLSYQSGLPIDTPYPASSYVPLFAGNVRPNRAAGVSPYSTAAQSDFDPGRDVYLNSAAWTSPDAFTFGNAARMSGARVKPLLNEDVSLLKNFGIYERLRLQFRAEAFDVFNRTVLWLPGTGPRRLRLRHDFFAKEQAEDDAARFEAAVLDV